MKHSKLQPITKLSAAVAGLIKSEMPTGSRVQASANQIILALSRVEVEYSLGNLLQHIYRCVDKHFPVRQENLSLIIRDREGIYENCFKIWGSGTCILKK